MKKFTKSDLRDGDVVEYDSGKVRLVKGGDLYNENGYRVSALDRYDENLESVGGSIRIVRAYRVMWEREERTITSDEKIILRNIDHKYKYIARDEDKKLYVYEQEPEKGCEDWKFTSFKVESMCVFCNLFDMVKWTDDEPWKIEDLLMLPEKDGDTK